MLLARLPAVRSMYPFPFRSTFVNPAAPFLCPYTPCLERDIFPAIAGAAARAAPARGCGCFFSAIVLHRCTCSNVRRAVALASRIS